MKHIILPALLLATNANAGLIEGYAGTVSAYSRAEGCVAYVQEVQP